MPGKKHVPANTLEESEYAVIRKLAPVFNLVQETAQLPRSLSQDETLLVAEAGRIHTALRVRLEYKWSWGAKPEQLYKELIRALNLHEHESELLEIARLRSKPGRKARQDIAIFVQQMQDAGTSALETMRKLEAKGTHLSLEGVESYRKSRRRSPR